MGRLRKVKDDILKLQQSDYFIADPANIKLKEHNEIEVGTGKGQFITNKASSNPEINYYGIDKFPTILLKAINKLNKNKIDINNLHFLSFDALDLNKYFPNHSIDCIYLNFSDPWPKKRHEKRRLTSKTYINIYKSILRPDGCIKYKTDNYDFFLFTKEELENHPEVTILEITDDLYNSEFIKDNIPTEYETKFVNMNKKINYIKFKFNH